MYRYNFQGGEITRLLYESNNFKNCLMQNLENRKFQKLEFKSHQCPILYQLSIVSNAPSMSLSLALHCLFYVPSGLLVSDGTCEPQSSFTLLTAKPAFWCKLGVVTKPWDPASVSDDSQTVYYGESELVVVTQVVLILISCCLQTTCWKGKTMRRLRSITIMDNFFLPLKLLYFILHVNKLRSVQLHCKIKYSQCLIWTVSLEPEASLWKHSVLQHLLLICFQFCSPKAGN